MRRTLTSLVLASVLWAGLWPLASMAEEPLAITLIPGFGSVTVVSGLTDPRGVVRDPPLFGFPCCIFVVEKSLNRISVAPSGGAPTPFATGLSTPTDLVPSPGGPFGNFLYVAESGANRISRIDGTGAVTSFTGSNLPAAPKRMAFSTARGPSPFGDFLFVTLANGTLVKVNASGGVSTCAGGLSSPEGLVFGPGGALRNNILFVTESTANKISKVDPACTVSPFASAGLSGPVGLEISPALPYGPLETTLYVVNATTKVDRVDKDGKVTPFASGFTQADTVRVAVFLPSLDPLSPNLTVSDAATGTITDLIVNRPFISVQLSGCSTCRAGDIFAVTLTVENQGPIDRPVEVKTGFRLPDGTPVNISPLNNKHFEAVLPKGFRFQGLWLSFAMPTVPPGRYCYEGSLTDPEIGTGFAFPLPRACFVVLP